MSAWLFVWVQNMKTGRPEPQKWPSDFPKEAQRHLSVLASHDMKTGEEKLDLSALALIYRSPPQPEAPVEWSDGRMT